MRYARDIIDEGLRADPRDAEGLTAKQRRFLKVRKQALSDVEALADAGFSLVDLLNWRAEPDFEREYSKLMEARSTIEDLRHGMDALAPMALNVIQDALEGKDVSKPRLQAAFAVLKAYGFDKVTIESVTTHVPYEAVLALSMVERGTAVMSLPPHIRDLLLKFYPQAVALPAADVVEIPSPTTHLTTTGA